MNLSIDTSVLSITYSSITPSSLLFSVLLSARAEQLLCLWGWVDLVELWTALDKTVMPCTVLTEAPQQTRVGQMMYTQDMGMSEMLPTDEIPRVPAMDNVIPQQWCRNHMENLQISLSSLHTSAHNCSAVAFPNPQKDTTHTHTQPLYTPVYGTRYTVLQGEIC